MWRSRIFWQLFGVCSSLLLLALGLMTALALHHVEALPSRDDDRQMIWLAAGLIALSVLLGIWWLARRVTKPLHELTEGVEHMEAGDYSHKILSSGQDELGLLARGFNRTSERLATQFRQLHAEREQLQAVLSSMVEGVIAIDQEQRILLANERAGQLLGLGNLSLTGRKLWEVLRHRLLQELVTKVLHEGCTLHQELDWNGPVVKSLTAHVGPLKGTAEASLPAHSVRAGKNRMGVVGAVLVLHDTTELRRLEQLRQEFVANVSHELKTPLAVIQAATETLLDGAIEDTEHRGQFLEQIAAQAEQLNHLILDLLSLARIEAGIETFAFQPVALEQVVATCAERRRSLVQARQQTLLLQPPAGGEPVVTWADEEAVDQILDNLLDNAIKYTPAGGRITLRWWNEGDWACLEVEDTGVGISAQDLPRIFERFYRVDRARSRELGGTGLGLSIVKHLTQALQGSVQAVSSLGVGSKFTVKLPRPGNKPSQELHPVHTIGQ